MVVAGKHDTVRPPAGTEELAKKIPGARFELIEEAGHFLPTTGPKTLLKLLKEFSAEVLFVGWVERSETHRRRTQKMMGFASLYPSYKETQEARG